RLMRIYLSGKNDSDFNNQMDESEYLASTLFAEETHFSVSVSVLYQSMKSLGRCSEYKTRENCLAECRVALFRQMCNCTPVTWSNWNSLEIYEECKLSNYTLCAIYSGYDDHDCVKEKCSTMGDLCERWIFNVQWLESKPSSTGARV